jgi:hypothetical protein
VLRPHRRARGREGEGGRWLITGERDALAEYDQGGIGSDRTGDLRKIDVDVRRHKNHDIGGAYCGDDRHGSVVHILLDIDDRAIGGAWGDLGKGALPADHEDQNRENRTVPHESPRSAPQSRYRCEAATRLRSETSDLNRARLLHKAQPKLVDCI